MHAWVDGWWYVRSWDEEYVDVEVMLSPCWGIDYSYWLWFGYWVQNQSRPRVLELVSRVNYFLLFYSGWYWKSTEYAEQYSVRTLYFGIGIARTITRRKNCQQSDQSTWIFCELVFPILFGCSYIIVSIMYNTGCYSSPSPEDRPNQVDLYSLYESTE